MAQVLQPPTTQDVAQDAWAFQITDAVNNIDPRVSTLESPPRVGRLADLPIDHPTGQDIYITTGFTVTAANQILILHGLPAAVLEFSDNSWYRASPDQFVAVNGTDEVFKTWIRIGF